jgi:hypothetical protein
MYKKKFDLALYLILVALILFAVAKSIFFISIIVSMLVIIKLFNILK